MRSENIFLLLFLYLFACQTVSWTDCTGNPEVALTITDATIIETSLIPAGNLTVHFAGESAKQIFSSMTRGQLQYVNGNQTIQQFFTDTCTAIQNYCPCPCDSISVQGDLNWRLISNIDPGEVILTVSSIHPSLKDVYFYCFELSFNITG